MRSWKQEGKKDHVAFTFHLHLFIFIQREASSWAVMVKGLAHVAKNGSMVVQGFEFISFQPLAKKKKISCQVPGIREAEGKRRSWIALLSSSNSSLVMGSSRESRMILAASNDFFPITVDLISQVYNFPNRSQISWNDSVYNLSVSAE